MKWRHHFAQWLKKALNTSNPTSSNLIILADSEHKTRSQGFTFRSSSIHELLQWSNLRSVGTSKSRKVDEVLISAMRLGLLCYQIFSKGLPIFSDIQEKYIFPLNPTLALMCFCLERRRMSFKMSFINLYNLDCIGLKSVTAKPVQ